MPDQYARVAHLGMHTHQETDELEVEVSIVRTWSRLAFPSPRADDVPKDIRGALRAWLETADDDG